MFDYMINLFPRALRHAFCILEIRVPTLSFSLFYMYCIIYTVKARHRFISHKKHEKKTTFYSLCHICVNVPERYVPTLSFFVLYIYILHYFKLKVIYTSNLYTKKSFYPLCHICVRVAAKKVIFLMARPLKGGGGKGKKL